MNFVRHGDVLLRPVKEVSGKQIDSTDKYIVAYGEVTGHTHTLSTATKNGITVFQDEQGNKYLDITGQARIKHQEHKELEVMPGKYQVVIEREHDYFLEQVRQVAD
jgi:hypothetical protein